MRAIPQIAFAFVEREEGFVSVPRRDSDGAWMDGYGNRSGVAPGRAVSIPQARLDLAANLATAASRLEWAIGPEMVGRLNNYEFAALLSFVFNAGAASSWQIWSDIRKGDLAAVPAELLRFDHAKTADGESVVVHGLYNRRLAESQLWAGTDPLCAAYPINGA